MQCLQVCLICKKKPTNAIYNVKTLYNLEFSNLLIDPSALDDVDSI